MGLLSRHTKDWAGSVQAKWIQKTGLFGYFWKMNCSLLIHYKLEFLFVAPYKKKTSLFPSMYDIITRLWILQIYFSYTAKAFYCWSVKVFWHTKKCVKLNFWNISFFFKLFEDLGAFFSRQKQGRNWQAVQPWIPPHVTGNFCGTKGLPGIGEEAL